MDFTGLGKLSAYEVGRPLSDVEYKGRLDSKKSVTDRAMDWISVVRINSSYLDLVDRWYAGKGAAAWLGCAVIVTLFAMIGGILVVSLEKNDLATWVFFAVAFILSIPFFWGGLYVLRLDSFRQTHYPVRLSRRDRLVYAFRPDGTVIRADWDELVFCEIKNKLTMGRTSYDVRAYVLYDDGVTIKDVFTLCYPDYGDRESLMMLWEYVRQYMEDPEGVKDCYAITELCPPVDGRREGLAFGVVRIFAGTAHHFVVQLLVSPIAALEILGRWFAMYTCKVPRWPDEIEAACQIDPDDPYQKDWRDNGKYDFWEFGWPLICFFVGLGVLGVGLTFLVRELLA
ncbi:DUF6708 domain-containing protein [Halomonas sp. V046]|uniref:DUF6708 domain-containing protein n=1 Tax=Halomonas sp. V046 TaxID=3459611 RepID=UPI004044243A